MNRKIINLLAATFISLSISACNSAQSKDYLIDDSNFVMVEKDIFSEDGNGGYQTNGKIKMYKTGFPGESDIYYINIEEAVNSINLDLVGEEINFDERGALIFNSVSGYSCKFSSIDNSFTCNTYTSKIDPFGTNYCTQKDSDIFQLSNMSVTPPKADIIDLNKYNLHIYQSKNDEKKFYMPLMTFMDLNDIDMARTHYVDDRGLFLFSSDLSLIDDKGNMTPYGEFVYSESETEWSEDFSLFQYNELCLSLDYHYGLSEKLNYDVDSYFKDNNYKDGLLSTNPQMFEQALCDAMFFGLDDGHTKYIQPGPKCGLFDVNKVDGPRRKIIGERENELNSIRAKNQPEIFDSMDCYYEIGNTAFVYIGEIDWLVPSQLEHVNSKIHRENSPIENVVIDLASNPGGMVDVAERLSAWLIGEVSEAWRDPLNGHLVSYTYRFDLNNDQCFDRNDTLEDYNVIVLESKGTFSAANSVVYSVRNASNVKLVGETSSGGSCCIMFITTASGSLIRISSRIEGGDIVDGSFISDDAGANPDIEMDPKLMFDYNTIIDLFEN